MAIPMGGAPMGVPFGSLTGTLEGDQVLLQMQALAQQQQNALANSAQTAAQGAQQAQNAYQQAAQAPPPDLSALQFLSTLGGGISEVLGNRGAAERQQQNVQQVRSAELKARGDNLQALRDVYSQKADAAQKAGDLETTEKYRNKMILLDKQSDLLMATLKRTQDLEDKKTLEGIQQQNALAQIAARGAEERKTNAAKPQGQGVYTDDDIQAAVADLAEGRTEITNVPAAYGFRTKVQAELRKQGKRIMPKKVRDALNEIGSAETVIDEIDSISQQVNTAKANFVARGLTGARNVANAVNQTGVAAQLETARGGLAGNLARAVAAERGVLTDQDRAYAMSLVPTLFDSEVRAKQKIGMLRRFIQSKKDRAIRVYTTEGAGENKPLPKENPKNTEVTVVAPNGKTYKFPSQEKADQFKKRAEIE